MQLVDESKYVRNVLDHMPANNLLELIVSEWIWKVAEVVNDVGVASRVRVDADRAGIFVLSTPNIKNSHTNIGFVFSRAARSCRLTA